MDKQEITELIDSELDFFKFDRLKTGDTILLQTLDRSTEVTILAITGSIFAVSQQDNSRKFNRWVTLTELQDWLRILAETLLITSDALFIKLKDF